MGNSIKGGKGGKGGKGSNDQSQNNNGIIYHFLYIYMDDDNSDELSSITNVLLSIVGPNIPELKNNGIYVEVFQLDKHTLKNKELIKLLKKNGILKLPVLKIHNGSENSNALIVGANQIIEYYNKYLGLSIPKQQNIQPKLPPQMQKASSPSQLARGPPPQKPLTKSSPIEDEYDEDLPIGSNKNITSKLDEMIKFREMSKQGYINNQRSHRSQGGSSQGNSSQGNSSQGSNHRGSSQGGSIQSSSQSSNRRNTDSKKKYTSITKEDLQDSPFKEGEFLNDDLDDNLDDNISSYTSSLLSSKSNPKTNAYSNMGDDEADDEKDELMIRAFWDNNFND